MKNLQKMSSATAACALAAIGVATFALPADAASKRANSYVAYYDTIDVEAPFVDGYVYGSAPAYSYGQITCALDTLSRTYPPRVNFSLIPAYESALATVCR